MNYRAKQYRKDFLKISNLLFISFLLICAILMKNLNYYVGFALGLLAVGYSYQKLTKGAKHLFTNKYDLGLFIIVLICCFFIEGFVQ